ncbi:hypothetical protein OF83DRAFT_1030323, partial [Amylostereum chailletii]
HFKTLMQVFDGKIPAQNVFNFDEIGIQLGGGCGGNGLLYFFAVRDKLKYRLKSDDLELVTVLETVCADGTAPVKPCLVFSGVNRCESWYEEDDDILYTNDAICAEWFSQNFILQAKAHADPTKPVVLI